MEGEQFENILEVEECVSKSVLSDSCLSIDRKMDEDGDSSFKDNELRRDGCETTSEEDGDESNENTMEFNSSGVDNRNLNQVLSETTTCKLDTDEVNQIMVDTIDSYVSGCETLSSKDQCIESARLLESNGENTREYEADRLIFVGNNEELIEESNSGSVVHTGKPESVESNENTQEFSSKSINGDEIINDNANKVNEELVSGDDTPLSQVLGRTSGRRKRKSFDHNECHSKRKNRQILINEPLESLKIYKFKSQWFGTEQCAHCNELFASRQIAKKHMLLKHARELMYECNYCAYKVRLKDRLSRHVASVHNRDPTFTTDIGIYKNAYDSSIDRREDTLRGNLVYRKCPYCFHETEASRMRNHILSIHRCNYKSYFCLYCNYKTSVLIHLQEHLIEHDDMKKYSCNFCIYRTVRKRYLKRHVENRHNQRLRDYMVDAEDEPEIYQCSQCAFVSCDDNSLYKHIIKTHQKQWSIVKKEDEKYFVNENSNETPTDPVNTDNPPVVQSVQTDNGQKKYSCTKCDFVTLYESLFNEHMACIHTKINDIQWYNCDYCDFTSIYSHSLKRHYETVHIKIRKRTNLITEEEPKIKSYECDFCKKIFLKKINIRRHVEQDHDIDRPYNCTACDFKAAKTDDISRHMRLHM